MSIPLKPLGDYVVAQAEAPETQSASGIYIPKSAAEKPKTSIVLSVGPLVTQVKKGDRIVYKGYSPDTTEVKVAGEEFVLVREADIVATVA